MHSQQWARVKAILESALATPEEIRIALVEEACKDDEEVLRDVLGLLAAHKRAETTDAFSGPFTRYEPPEVALPDRLVGPYRLIRLIGRGGMGSVYLADRADDEFQRQVALKILRRGVDTEDVLARFMHERQILARLNHPNIATLYDGGAREDGRPYFAMEYVRGEPIVEHCDGRKMSVRQRLDLFRVVCQAVHYAHANLVVHRDLKPSNIFVTDDGTVKLLDFGIARLLRSDDDEATELRTRPGARWLTPDYAAPEQIRGEPVTTATDVYQLGVLLYELLTGTRPFGVDKDGTGLEARERGPARLTAVVTEETARHRSVELPRLRRQLAGDLETIVSQALQADPSRRYPSAEALAEDVRRHLVGLPLVARSDTMLYRITRFVKRHRSVSVAAALTVLAIVAGTVATAWQARVASIERDNARAEAAKAEQVNDFLQSMLSAASPTRSGRDVRVVEVLDAAVARVGDELADQPELEAAVRRTLGITYEDLGLYDEAEVLLRRALELRIRHLGANHPETAQSLKDLALVRHWKGDLDSAAVLYRDAIERFRAQDEPGRGLAEALNDYGTLLLDVRRFDEAESSFREALTLMRRFLGDSHRDVASNLNNIALVLHERKDGAGAAELFEESLEIQRRAAGRDNIDVAYTLNNLAWVYRDMGDLEAADSLLRLSIDIRRRELGDGHPSVAVGLNNLAMLVLLPSGKVDAADSVLTDATAVLARANLDEHPYVASLMSAQGRVRLAQKRFAEAERLFRDAFEMRKRLLGENSVDALSTVADLGAALIAQGKRQEARRILSDALPTLESGNHESAVRVMTLLSSTEP